ncbi:MAG TPA: M20 family metallo-hydrolase [Candidatus Dormibacteraeota bacterium]|nr:M20 family metallo-hydrolase [Candidatus Dormibacteraeota bacterium]
MSPSSPPPARRTWDRLRELAEITAPGDGVSRDGYSAYERLAQDLVGAWMRDAGLSVTRDHAGNLRGRVAGRDPLLPAVWVGSHLDSVPGGGRFDGAYGVVGGLAAVEAATGGETPLRSIELVAFACEEGARFGTGLLGSRGLVEGWADVDVDALVDRDGVSLRAALASVGLDAEAVRAPSLTPGSVHCFVELHVEQGPVLDTAAATIGVVSAIAAPTYLRVRFEGAAGHAGTTPMVGRRDALVGAAEAILEVERAARSYDGAAVSTVGFLAVHPNSANVIPGSVTFSVDVRALDADTKRRLVEEIAAGLQRTAQARSLQLSVATLADLAPVACHPPIQGAVRDAATSLGLPWLDMPSGAYHDAMAMSRVCPVGMVFVPSARGLSHVAEEWTSPDDLEHGVDVLAEVLRTLASTTGIEGAG